MRNIQGLTLCLALLPAARAAGGEAAAVLKIGVGARPLGMGGAYTAIAEDVEAVAWNPSGLAAVDARDVSFVHSTLVAGTRFDFLGFAQPTRVGTLALAARHLSQGRLDGRDALGRPTAGFSASDSSAELAFAHARSPRLRLGGGLRFVRSGIADASAHSVAADLGAMSRLAPLGPGVLQLGLALQNLGPGLRFLDESAPLPLTVAAGAGYLLPAGLTLALDIRHRPRARASELQVGTEYQLGAGLAIRAGFASARAAAGGAASAALKGLSGGFGLKALGLHVDYAVTPFGELGNAHHFSLGARF